MVGVKYWTLKYNPVTSWAAKQATRHRGRNLKCLIFTATTGRSGTLSLARVFAAVPKCMSYHEPWPDMHGAELINVDAASNTQAAYLYRCVKSVNIRRYSYDATYYFEANHVFIKNFYRYVVAEFYGMVKVIHLIRDPVDVAQSIYTLNHSPGTTIGNQWYFDYRSKSNRIQLAEVLDKEEEYKHSFYRCLWYWYEVEERVRLFREAYPFVPVVDFRTEDLNRQDKIERLLASLEIECDPAALRTVTGVCEHRHTSEKGGHPRTQRPVASCLSKELATEMNVKFRELLRERGYTVAA